MQDAAVATDDNMHMSHVTCVMNSWDMNMSETLNYICAVRELLPVSRLETSKEWPLLVAFYGIPPR